MNSRERFLSAARSQPVDRPPIWVMRQAGRHLPEYLALKEKYTFHQMVQTPELACEVTMQPIRRYSMDAAIIFSDILVIPEALGQPYHFRDIGGIEMEYRIESEADVEKLDPSGVREKLDYVVGALKTTREALGDERALIGFGGAPWTLATYMVEGGSSKDYSRAKKLFYTNRPLFDALMQKVTDACIEYFQMQIEAGVDAVQIFDSWGGVLAPDAFGEASVQWMRQIVESVKGEVPVIVFSKGAHEHLDDLVSTGADVLGMSWTTNLADVATALPDNVAVQGNLDPVLMETDPDTVRAHTTALLESMRGKGGHIFNLGHGISPRAKIECMTAMAETVREFK